MSKYSRTFGTLPFVAMARKVLVRSHPENLTRGEGSPSAGNGRSRTTAVSGGCGDWNGAVAVLTMITVRAVTFLLREPRTRSEEVTADAGLTWPRK